MLPYQTSSLLAPAHALCGPYVDTGVHDFQLLRPGQARPGTRDHAPRELAVDSDRIGEAHAAPLEGVEGQAVELLQPPIPALDEMEVGEVAVEQDGGPWLKELQEGQPRAELVDEEGIWPQGGELAVEADLDEEVQLPRDGAKDAELGEDRGWEDGVAAHANLKGSFGRWSQQLLTGGSCVCWAGLVVGMVQEAGGTYVPSLASSKQCLGSQWLVKMTTLWPLFCSPTAASTTNLSAPPMPRSGWKKTIVFFFAVAVVSAILPWSWLSLAFPCILGATLGRGHVSAFQHSAT